MFEETAETARCGRDPGAYRAAIGLYTGEFLPNDLYDEWTQERREGLRRLYRALLLELAILHEEDTGPNGLQNFPVISSAVNSKGSTTIRGSLNSTPFRTFTIQFFNSPAPDPSGNGEGKTFLGQTQVETNRNGNVSFTFVPNRVAPLSTRVTATATAGNGNTSEFSNARIVTRPPL